MLKKLYIGSPGETLPLLSILLGFVVLALYQWHEPYNAHLIGLLLVATGAFAALYQNRNRLTLGSAVIWVPLLIIVVSALASMPPDGYDLNLNLAYMAFLAFCFLLYLLGRVYGTRLFGVLAVAGFVLAVTVIVEALVVRTGFKDGFDGVALNSNVVGCFMVMSAFFCRGNLKWLVLPIVVAVVLTGAHGAIAGLILVGLYLFISGELRPRVVPPRVQLVGLAVAIALIPILVMTGILGGLYDAGSVRAYVNGDITLDELTLGRLSQYERAVDSASFTGYGLPPTGAEDGPYGKMSIHNAPLEIMHEIGIIAAVCWSWVLLYMIYKTKQLKPVFIIVAVVSVVSNFLWWPYILGAMTWYLFGVGSREMEKR